MGVTMGTGIKYATADGVHIAYQVRGDGPIDLVLAPDGIIPIEAMGEERRLARFLDRLASFSRLICFDRRGIGSSDPVTPATPLTLEQWADDALAVTEAVGASRPVVLGIAEGGFVATLLAATHPDRVGALVLVNATPGIGSDPFADEGEAGHFIAELAKTVDEGWGDDQRVVDGISLGTGAAVFAPSAAGEADFVDWLGRTYRRAASPAVARAIFNGAYLSDIRPILSTVGVPTLVLHRAGNRWFTPAHGRYLAEHIPGARYVEVPGVDHLPYLGDVEALVGEIEEFLTGARRAWAADRVLATVLFTDIVASTDEAVRRGDRGWHELLDRHDEMVRHQLDRFRGREVNTTGDGFLATFDGPARAINCAVAIAEGARRLGVEVRAGLHAGECEVRGDDIAGIAVHIGQRVAATARPGEVLVTSTVKDLVVGSGIEFDDRGDHELKGVPGTWRLHAVKP